MANFYAVQHGNDYSSDYGSTNKRKAYSMAHALKREYPQDEIRISAEETAKECGFLQITWI